MAEAGWSPGCAVPVLRPKRQYHFLFFAEPPVLIEHGLALQEKTIFPSPRSGGIFTGPIVPIMAGNGEIGVEQIRTVFPSLLAGSVTAVDSAIGDDVFWTEPRVGEDDREGVHGIHHHPRR